MDTKGKKWETTKETGKIYHTMQEIRTRSERNRSVERFRGIDAMGGGVIIL